MENDSIKQKKTISIAIVGIGGVGGYFGGLLAYHYANSSNVKVYFVARGENLRAIRKNGMELKALEGNLHLSPTLATDQTEEIGIVDYILLTTKSYDIEQSVNQIKPMVGANTIILPLLNGIGNTTEIRRLLPNAEVWQGCCYIVARLNKPGEVESSSRFHHMQFGNELAKSNEKLLEFEKILKNANIEASFHQNILEVIWTKFFFISVTASLTSYFDVSFGALLDNEFRRKTMLTMLDELFSVAIAEEVRIQDSVKKKVIIQLENLPYQTTSSMHSDFKAGKTTEIDSLAGSVVRLAKKHNISVPTYKLVYNKLTGKNAD